MRPWTTFPLQRHRGRLCGCGVKRKKIRGLIWRQRHKRLILTRRVPLALKLIDEPLQEPCLGGEIVVFLLRV
jgi:hypothetical protein